jgi:acyl-CoA thioester hydrolase
MAKQDFRHHCTLRVRWSECDAQGIVYYARYFDYVDIGLAEYFRNLGMRLYDEKQRAHFDTATVKATLEYKAPARVDDVLNVYTRIVKIGATSITAETEIYRERSGELLTWVETVSVGFDSATGTSRVVPDDVRARVNRFEETDESVRSRESR